MSHPERVALNNAQKACFADAASSACGTVTALQLKDQLSDKLLANATASCVAGECKDVSNFILKEMSAQGCTPPNACPDNALLSQYWRIAQEKAQGLEPVYPEGWLLDAKAALDFGKLGVSLLSSASTGAKGSLEALTQLAKTDVLPATRANGGVGEIVTVIESKIAQQMGPRGWTPDSMEATIANPAKTVITQDTRFDPISGTRLSDPATGYVAKDGSYVVRNDRTGQIVQISNKNDPTWKAPWDK